MAEPENIKKSIIYPDQFDDPNINYIRFRIVSEDGSKTSQWSPVYVVDTTP